MLLSSGIVVAVGSKEVFKTLAEEAAELVTLPDGKATGLLFALVGCAADADDGGHVIVCQTAGGLLAQQVGIHFPLFSSFQFPKVFTTKTIAALYQQNENMSIVIAKKVDKVKTL